MVCCRMLGRPGRRPAYASVELAWWLQGDLRTPEEDQVPKAINSIMWCVVLPYVGSVSCLDASALPAPKDESLPLPASVPRSGAVLRPAGE